MDKKTITDKIKVLLHIDTQLAQYEDAEGTVFEAEALEAGKVLWLITPDGKEAAAPGKYRFGDMEVLIQDGGVIEEVIDLTVESTLEETSEEESTEETVEATEENPAEETTEVEETTEEVQTVSLEDHNALLQRVTDLEEVVETLTDALAKFRLETDEAHAEEVEASEVWTPAKKKVEASETPAFNTHTATPTERIFNAIQFSDAN